LANGDSLVLADLRPAWAMLADESTDGVVVGLEVADASRYGRLDVTDDGRLLRFSEKQPGSGLINAGIYLLRRRLLDRFPRRTPLSMEHDVFPALLDGGARLRVHRCQAPFLDIGTPETVAQADSFITRHFLAQVAA
jgi:D-glycero-alpha-D-manno-heptose 1-phosphate guanylyltransferase